jgi:hypothetical protein
LRRTVARRFSVSRPTKNRCNRSDPGPSLHGGINEAITDAGAVALAAAPGLANLAKLHVGSHNRAWHNIGERGMAALRERFGAILAVDEPM